MLSKESGAAQRQHHNNHSILKSDKWTNRRSFDPRYDRRTQTSMSDNKYITKGGYRLPEFNSNCAPIRPGISSTSIANTVRSGMPSKKSKYDNHVKIDELYSEWFRSSRRPPGSLGENVLLRLYEFYKPRIMAIVKKYRALSPVFDDDDLQQTALLGMLQALIKYDHATHVEMKFSTYLEWSIRNVFQRAIGYSDKFVEIYNNNNDLLFSISYQEFLSRKKVIESAGNSYVIRSRVCHFSDITLSGSLNSCSAVPGEFMPSCLLCPVNTMIDEQEGPLP